ncbi:hypothetical protein BH11PLA2_BH11PLA2_01800 [soil metagenome]
MLRRKPTILLKHIAECPPDSIDLIDNALIRNAAREVWGHACRLHDNLLAVIEWYDRLWLTREEDIKVATGSLERARDSLRVLFIAGVVRRIEAINTEAEAMMLLPPWPGPETLKSLPEFRSGDWSPLSPPLRWQDDPRLWELWRVRKDSADRLVSFTDKVIAQLVGSPASITGDLATPQKHEVTKKTASTGVKGKGINAKMLKSYADDSSRAVWTQYQWAEHLGCSPSTISETDTWRQLNPVRTGELAKSRKPDRRRKSKKPPNDG